MGLFNNIKTVKDQFMEYEAVQNIDQLQMVFDTIDTQAEKETERKIAEMEHFESLSPDEKIEYKRQKRRNKQLKRLLLYGLATTVKSDMGVPVLMAANIGEILCDDSLSFNQNLHDAKVARLRGKNQKQLPKPRQYFSISYDEEGLPNVSTIVDRDPYNLQQRYEELMRE